MTASDAAVTVDVPVVETDIPCRCGYNLRGLPRDGRCPECALSVEEGLRAFAQPYDAEQLRRVVVGIVWLLIAHAGWLVTVFALAPFRVSFWAYALLGVAGPTTFLTLIQARRGANFVIMVALVLASLLWLTGVWQATAQPSPGRAGAAALGRCARYVTLIGWAVIAGSYVWWEDALAAGSLVYDAIAAALLWAYLARLARQARLDRLSIATWWVGSVLVVAKLMFAANIKRDFNDWVFWLILGSFAATGLGASLFLILLRRALNQVARP